MVLIGQIVTTRPLIGHMPDGEWPASTVTGVCVSGKPIVTDYKQTQGQSVSEHPATDIMPAPHWSNGTNTGR